MVESLMQKVVADIVNGKKVKARSKSKSKSIVLNSELVDC